MSGRSIFVTGTDTGVGKTLVAGLLARFFAESGLNTVTQKWVQTGCNDVSDDISEHLSIMGRSRKDYDRYLEDMEPCILGLPASPHLAARIEGKEIDIEKITGSLRRLENDFDAVVIEGAGGIMVPVNDKVMIIDICEKEKLPVLITAANRLGAINQTVLTVSALRKKGIEIAGIIFNRLSEDVDKVVMDDNPFIIKDLTGVDVLADLPYEDDQDKLYESFIPAGRRILETWRGHE